MERDVIDVRFGDIVIVAADVMQTCTPFISGLSIWKAVAFGQESARGLTCVRTPAS